MHLVVPGTLTPISLPVLGLTLVSQSWLLASQLNSSVAAIP
jgi:hypothetical protein